MTRRTSPHSTGAAPGEGNQRGQDRHGRSPNHNERINQGREHPQDDESVNLQRGTDYDYDMGERRPSGTKGEMTNSDEIY